MSKRVSNQKRPKRRKQAMKSRAYEDVLKSQLLRNRKIRANRAERVRRIEAKGL